MIEAKLVPIAGAILALVVLFGLANYVVPNLLVYVTKASRTGKFSAANSYLFASFLDCKADNEQKVLINVFLLDKEGHGVWSECCFKYNSKETSSDFLKFLKSGQYLIIMVKQSLNSHLWLPEIFEITNMGGYVPKWLDFSLKVITEVFCHLTSDL